MAVTSTRMTAEQYFATSVEGDRTQLVGGELVVNEPRPLHGKVQMRIATALETWAAAEAGRGEAFLPIDVVLGDLDVYGPDVVWFAEGRVPTDWTALAAHPPDLVVEVRSPGTWRHDVGRKKAMYERGGVRELWLADTSADAALVYRRSDAAASDFDVALELGPDKRLESTMLPGFSLDVTAVFRR